MLKSGNKYLTIPTILCAQICHLGSLFESRDPSIAETCFRKTTQNRARGAVVEVQLFKGQWKRRENNLLCKDKVERKREREGGAGGGGGGDSGSGQMRGGCGRSRLPAERESE